MDRRLRGEGASAGTVRTCSTVVLPPSKVRGVPLLRQERNADSPLVERVTRVVFDGDDPDVSTPDGCWAFLRPVAGDRSFWFEGERFEIPSFENAEGLVARLTRRSALVRDEIVAGIADGDPRAISERTVQRHFQLSMGVTAKRFEQIRRVRQAVDLLQRGTAVATVAHELGYSDQAHLTRVLKAMTGRTPGVIARQAAR
jgi:hypothetical protein